MPRDQSTDDDVPDIDLRDAPRFIKDEWSRRTWYGKLHVLVWEAAGMVIVLALISILKAFMYLIEGIEENWPSKYKEVDDATE